MGALNATRREFAPQNSICTLFRQNVQLECHLRMHPAPTRHHRQAQISKSKHMTPNQHITALIVAAGRGQRAGGGLPKQWRDLGDKSIAQRSVDALLEHPAITGGILVVSPQDDPDHFPSQVQDGTLQVVHGGATRRESVLAGLTAAATGPTTQILIHDAARPLLPASVIDRVIDALAHGPAAAPALAITDALWTVDKDQVTGLQDRNGLARAQTPQGFNLKSILDAHHAHVGDAADDVAVALAAGLPVTVVAGDPRNLKITGPDDFDRAARLLEGSEPMADPAKTSDFDIRTGTGYDVHRFGPGDHVVLCGIRVPHGRGLQGHSDADVGMHALTDAIYGALAEGDIGRHFPPSDPQWKGAPSDIFLRHACDLARDQGYRISNADVTLICEYPKIGPHASDMISEMARICELPTDRMSIKATTSERLGFTGREEGIAAMAAVTLVRP